MEGGGGGRIICGPALSQLSMHGCEWVSLVFAECQCGQGLLEESVEKDVHMVKQLFHISANRRKE